MSAPKRKKIVFVCTGNTCRSPMAEMLLKRELASRSLKGFTVCSAGLQARKGDTVNPKSRQVLAENGIEVEKFTSKQLTEKTVREALFIVCMTERQRDYLMDFRWNALKKAEVEEKENNVYSFYDITGYEVPDPYGKGLDCYRYVYNLFAAGIETLVEKLELSKHAYIPKTKKSNGAPKKRGRPKKGE